MNPITIDPNRLKFESKVYDNTPKPPKRGGWLAAMSSAIGAIAAPVGFAATPFFPPALAIGAGGLAMNRVGTYAQQRQMEKKWQQSLPPTPDVGYFPGVVSPGSGYIASPTVQPPAGIPLGAPTPGGAVDREALDILSSKQETMNVMAQNPGGM